MEHRPMFAALGLFVGGLIVGSAGGGGHESNAHAATVSPPGAAAMTGRGAAVRGLVSSSLRRTTEPEPLSWASGGKHRRRPEIASHDDGPFGKLKMPALPIDHPDVVRDYLQYFTDNAEGRKNFAAAVRRSGRYSEVISKALRERGLPVDLAAVVLVESGFSPEALSPAGAAGMWQFMPETAKAYGLLVERDLDERNSIWLATEAAAHHLADLYERFRSWDLALAAYNLGFDGLERRLDDAGVDDFWSLADAEDGLPDETAAYVPKVLAAAIALQNLEELGFGDVKRDAPIEAGELEVLGGTKLSLVARAAGTSVRTLHELNPELLGERVPDRGEKSTVHVPSAGVSRANVMLQKLVNDPDAEGALKVSDDFDWGKDDVHTGHSRLERTASTHSSRPRRRSRHHSTSTTSTERTEKAKLAIDEPKLRAADETPKKRDRDRDEDAPAPTRDVEPALVPERTAKVEETPPPPPAAPAAAHVFYRVVPGDSVAQIAATVGLTVDQVLAQAHVSTADQVRVGALLELEVPKQGVSDTRHPLVR